MTSEPVADGPREPAAAAEGILESIRVEVDRRLREGEAVPGASEWTTLHPELREEIEELVALRVWLFEEGLAEEEDAGEENAPGDPREEDLLAFIEGEVQDTLNRGEIPDLGAYEARHPDLASAIQRLGEQLGFVHEILSGEGMILTAPRNEDRGALGKYRLHHRVAIHGTGPIYLASTDDAPGHVELLILRPQIPAERALRTLEDAEAMRGLQGQGLVPLREVGEVRGVRFIAWEHLEGISLEQTVLDLAFHGGDRTVHLVTPPRGFPVGTPESADDLKEAFGAASSAARRLARDEEHLDRIVGIVEEVARILARAHSQGYLHLDIHPSAVLVDQQGRPHLRWFGLNRHYRAVVADGEPSGIFLAPEQAFPGMAHIDWRADIYGCGALLYTLLRLEPPYRVLRNGPGLREMYVNGPVPLRRCVPELPERLVEIIETAMQASPDRRMTSCLVLADQLQAFRRGESEVAAEVSAESGVLRRLIGRIWRKR